jgi:RNA polymerase sigma factor (sigma-70 family)
MREGSTLEDNARRALEGNRDALDALVRAVQHDVYGLAIRMLWNREDAEDATQDILVRVVTRLSQFDFRSQLKTWVYRIAVNYLLDVKKSRVERLRLSLGQFADDLAQGLSTDGPRDAERSVLTEEVKIGCTLGMLQCLDRPHRLAYILGDILELSGPQAAEVLDVASSVFRKRLQRARKAITTFTRAYCGLASDDAQCRCNRRVPAALQLRRVRAESLDFARDGVSFEEVRALVRRVEDARWALEVHRTSRPRTSDIDFARRMVHMIDATPDRAASEAHGPGGNDYD